MKTVNVNITIQLEVAEDGNTLSLVKDQLELLNTIIDFSCLENQAHIFIEEVSSENIILMKDGVPVGESFEDE